MISQGEPGAPVAFLQRIALYATKLFSNISIPTQLLTRKVYIRYGVAKTRVKGKGQGKGQG